MINLIITRTIKVDVNVTDLKVVHQLTTYTLCSLNISIRIFIYFRKVQIGRDETLCEFAFPSQ